MGERILDSNTAGDFDRALKGFGGVCMCGNGSIGYFNAKRDWNIDTGSNEHAPPATKQS